MQSGERRRKLRTFFIRLRIFCGCRRRRLPGLTCYLLGGQFDHLQRKERQTVRPKNKGDVHLRARAINFTAAVTSWEKSATLLLFSSRTWQCRRRRTRRGWKAAERASGRQRVRRCPGESRSSLSRVLACRGGPVRRSATSSVLLTFGSP